MPESFGLPLYEGVDWNSNANRYDNVTDTVSLFTREWIEIAHDKRLYKKMLSPSLRGSGLKSFLTVAVVVPLLVSLFTREWIEISNRSM